MPSERTDDQVGVFGPRDVWLSALHLTQRIGRAGDDEEARRSDVQHVSQLPLAELRHRQDLRRSARQDEISHEVERHEQRLVGPGKPESGRIVEGDDLATFEQRCDPAEVEQQSPARRPWQVELVEQISAQRSGPDANTEGFGPPWWGGTLGNMQHEVETPGADDTSRQFIGVALHAGETLPQPLAVDVDLGHQKSCGSSFQLSSGGGRNHANRDRP